VRTLRLRVPGGTGFAGGSLRATVNASAGSVKSTTHVPAWYTQPPGRKLNLNGEAV
jgi:hypothetical protein